MLFAAHAPRPFARVTCSPRAGGARACERRARSRARGDEIDYLAGVRGAGARSDRRGAHDVRAGEQRTLPAQDLQSRLRHRRRRRRALFRMIQNTYERSPDGTLSAYSDNAAVLEGSRARASFPTPRAVFTAYSTSVHRREMSRRTTIRPRSLRTPAPRRARAARSATKARPVRAPSRRRVFRASPFRTSNSRVRQPWEGGRRASPSASSRRSTS